MKPVRSSLLALLVLLLAGCGSSDEPRIFDDIHFTDQPPIRLDVSAIDVKVTFNPTFLPPEVEQNFPVPPQRALENWIHDRLVASSPQSPYHAVVLIKDAAVLEHDEPQARRYDAHLSLELQIIDENGFHVRTATADASARESVPDGTSLNDQDETWYNMTRRVVFSLGHELERQIRDNFFPYAR